MGDESTDAEGSYYEHLGEYGYGYEADNININNNKEKGQMARNTGRNRDEDQDEEEEIDPDEIDHSDGDDGYDEGRDEEDEKPARRSASKPTAKNKKAPQGAKFYNGSDREVEITFSQTVQLVQYNPMTMHARTKFLVGEGIDATELEEIMRGEYNFLKATVYGQCAVPFTLDEMGVVQAILEEFPGSSATAEKKPAGRGGASGGRSSGGRSSGGGSRGGSGRGGNARGGSRGGNNAKYDEAWAEAVEAYEDGGEKALKKLFYLNLDDKYPAIKRKDDDLNMPIKYATKDAKKSDLWEDLLGEYDDE